MKRKYLVYAVVFLVLAVLVCLQFRTWKNFDWARLFQFQLNWSHIVHGVGYIFIAYFLRAVRWNLFLRPVRKQTSVLSLLPPTLIGFTGLALLGRPGELIRPYLISRREKLPFASQMAVWAVERIFDVAAFTLLIVAAIFLPSKLHTFMINARPDVRHWIHITGYSLIVLVVGLLLAAMLMAYRGNRVAEWVETRFTHLALGLGHRIAHRIREFTEGLNTIHGPFSFVLISGLSVLMWWVIALSYKEVTHAYGEPALAMSATEVLLLMGGSMIGSMVQLPGVGGGSQLATISVLDHVFDVVPKELAVSCGIMLWLVTFVAVVPVGLFLAHRERLSLRKLSQETAKAEETEQVESSPRSASRVQGR